MRAMTADTVTGPGHAAPVTSTLAGAAAGPAGGAALG
jgi:hypothetical protein